MAEDARNAQAAADQLKSEAEDAAGKAENAKAEVKEKTEAMNDLAKDLDDLKIVLRDAQEKAEAAGAVQQSVQEAYDKVVDAIDSLKKLTAQAQVEKAQYEALVEQYNQAMDTYKEALANAEGLDEKLSELDKAVQSAIAAAEGRFTYGTLNTGNGTPYIPPVITAEETAGEISEIADELVPLASVSSGTAGGDHSKVGDETESIVDDSVPLAAAVDQQSNKNAVGIMGMIAAAFAPLLLLFKRKKDEEEDEEKEQAVQ